VYELPPHVFAEADKNLIQKLITEGESTNKIMGVDDDYNNGLSRDWIRVPFQIIKIKKAQYSYYEK